MSRPRFLADNDLDEHIISGVIRPLPRMWDAASVAGGDRMIRRLFTFASVLSLLLCAATVVLWVRSYWFYDLVAREAYSGIGTELMSVSRRLIFYHFNSYTHDPPPQEWGIGQISSSSP